jgi:hypothetical protein
MVALKPSNVRQPTPGTVLNLPNSAAAVSPSPSPSTFGPEKASPNSELSPALKAALLLAAAQVARELGLERPTTPSILQATGAGRSRAYELRGRVVDKLGELQRPPGRPPAPPPPSLEAGLEAELRGHMLRYLLSHPGAMASGSTRNHYSEGLRHFVLELRQRYHHVPLDAFAQAVQIPADTLAGWLRVPAAARAAEPASEAGSGPALAANDEQKEPSHNLRLAHIETVLHAWKHWDGSFTAFGRHVRHHLRIPWGLDVLRDILDALGVRTPKRRPGRSPDEKALRRQFETFFPGAQWVGDGSPIPIEVLGHRFVFNFELITDACSSAYTGFDVRDHEDSQAVVSAFNHSVHTTGAPPLALLLDPRPSNLAQEVYDILGPTLLIPATPGRAENKAHAEGTFGLFQQQAPPLVIHGSTLRETARQILILVLDTWLRASNHRPRADRGGRSRTQIYLGTDPTPEEIEEARTALRQRLRKQERAQQTRRRRADPLVRHTLDQAFEHLGLPDPHGNLRDAIAIYPLDAVIEAISIFEGKLLAQTLPPGAEGRYLLGIVRNLAQEHEALEIAQALWKNRCAARDHAFQRLHTQRQLILDQTPGHVPHALVAQFLDRALDSHRRFEGMFWLEATAETLLTQPPPTTEPLFHFAAQRIAATFRVPYEERLQALRFLAARILPLHHLHDIA